MFEDKLRRRLRRWQQRCNSASRPVPLAPQRVSPSQGERRRFHQRLDRAHDQPTTITACQTRSQLTEGREVQRGEGQYLLLERPLARVFSSADSLLTRWQSREKNAEVQPPVDPKHEILTEFQRHFPERALFLDLETCGLAGAAIFLAGLIRYDQGQLVLSQLWARNYAEEAALIAALGEIVRANQLLVTFNGKTFDWPQVRDRTIRYAARTGTLPELAHFDLLHHSRRKFGKRFGDCRLQTLELHVCGRRRFGDIPGHAIPDVYAEYVRTANDQLVEPILHHNALDLVTLWQLALDLGSDALNGHGNENTHSGQHGPRDF